MLNTPALTARGQGKKMLWIQEFSDLGGLTPGRQQEALVLGSPSNDDFKVDPEFGNCRGTGHDFQVSVEVEQYDSFQEVASTLHSTNVTRFSELCVRFGHSQA